MHCDVSMTDFCSDVSKKPNAPVGNDGRHSGRDH